MFYCCFQLGDGHQYRGTYASESPSPIRSSALIIEQPKTNVGNPSSPQISRHISSTTNPFDTQQPESNPPSVPSKEEPESNDEVVVGTLLDITFDDTSTSQSSSSTAAAAAPPPPPSSQSSLLINTENDLFNLHMDSQTNFSTPIDLLGVDFTSMSLDKPILHRNASKTIFTNTYASNINNK